MNLNFLLVLVDCDADDDGVVDVDEDDFIRIKDNEVDDNNGGD